MLYTEELNRYKNYCEQILKKIEEYKSNLSQYQSTEGNTVPDNLSGCVENLKKAAEEVVEKASSSVKIGVMGEFSSGKTTLLGSLLGYAGALPESEKASTGNVTYLKIKNAESKTDIKQTQFQFQVEYFNQTEVKECLDFMLNMVQKNSSIRELFDEQKLGTLKELHRNNEVSQQVVDWCKEVSSKTDINPKLSKQIKEIEAFAQSYIWYGAIVCDTSKPIDDVDIDTIPSALQLFDKQMDKKEFHDIPADKEKLKTFLQASFYLIRRINVEVKVSKNIWDLSSIQGANKLVLLDFPGVGNADSGVRDQFLSRREMENVQTILILTDGRRPGDDRPLEIINMLKQQQPNQVLDDFFLAGVGRFDEMEIDLEANIPNESSSQQISLSQVGVLEKAIKSVRDCTKQRDQNIVLLSGFMALDTMRVSKEVQVVSNKILGKLNEATLNDKFKHLRKECQQLSQRLQESEPTVANLLKKVAEDGGISHLRLLLENHVKKYGLKQLYEDVRDKEKKLYEQRTNLREILNNPLFEKQLREYKSSPLYKLEQVIQELTKDYKALRTYLDTSPLELGVKINKDKQRSGIPVTEVVNNEVNFSIFNWSEWRNLINNLKNGTINIPLSENRTQARANFLKRLKNSGNSDNPDQSQENTPPTKSDDFYNTFEKTVKNLEKDTREKIDEAIESFLNELSNDRVSLPADDTVIDLSSLHRQLINCSPDSEVKHETLLLATKPIELKDTIKDSIKEDDKLQAIEPKYIFPLACKDEVAHKPGQKFIWHPEITDTISGKENHQITMLQIRDAIISSVSQKLIELVCKANKLVEDELIFVLENIILELENLSKNEQELRGIVYGDSQPDSSIPDWLKSLNELNSINESYLKM